MSFEQPRNIDQEIEQERNRFAENIAQLEELTEKAMDKYNSLPDKVKEALLVGTTGVAASLGAFVGTAIAPGTELPALGGLMGLFPLLFAGASAVKKMKDLATAYNKKEGGESENLSN